MRAPFQFLALIAAVLLGGSLLVAHLDAQDAAKASEAPALSEVERLTITLLESRVEASSLRLVLAQREAETFLNTLRKEGFTLQRGQDGIWAYTPAR